MDDYIKREDAIKELLGCVPTDAHEIKDLDVIRVMLALPAADVAPVRHAKWIDDDEEYLRHGYQFANCSVCGFQMDVHENRGYYNYCPLCGAKMDEEDTNE